MGVFTSQRGSFMHICRKFGAKSVHNHKFITLLKEKVQRSDAWLPITRELAQMLVKMPGFYEKVACKEPDQDNRPPDDTDYCAVYENDLDDNGQFPAEWQTFVLTD
jgi:hypothetical protein